MAERADDELTALIRRVLPPRSPEWRVEVVDNPEEACAMFSRNLLRVQRHWRQAVHDAGMHLVMMHYPLSLDRIPSGRRAAVDLWKARAIRRIDVEFFTEVRGYVARTTDDKGLAFDENRKDAAQLAEEAENGPTADGKRSARTKARRDAEAKARLRERMSQVKYSGGFPVDLAAFELLLPRHLLDAYAHYENGVPIVQIENDVMELVPSLSDLQLHDIEVKLERYRSRAEVEWERDNYGLDPRDADALCDWTIRNGF